MDDGGLAGPSVIGRGAGFVTAPGRPFASVQAFGGVEPFSGLQGGKQGITRMSEQTQGEAARVFRESMLGMTQKELADALGCGKLKIIRMEQASTLPAEYRLSLAAIALGLESWRPGQRLPALLLKAAQYQRPEKEEVKALRARRRA